MSEVVLELAGGSSSGCVLRIRTLPGQEEWQGIQLLHLLDPLREAELSQATVQLLEESEYDYAFLDCGPHVLVEPHELFDASDANGLVGRLRPRRSTGTVSIQARAPDGLLLGTSEVEVRSRKLNYLSEYRWMLQRIADESAEAVQSQFAASKLGAFRPHSIGDSETLYQRFAFIQSLLGSSEFRSSLAVLLKRPHHEYRPITVDVEPSKGLKGNSSLIRSLLRPGPRQPAGIRQLPSVPLFVDQVQYEETLDTVPNRFAKHALTQWRNLAGEVSAASAKRGGPSGRRGEREAEALIETLEETLRSPIFHDVGVLTSFPKENTVLQRRAGYRDVFRAYLQVEAAALVDWGGGGDAFGAGQRDVATLYEYWVFLELARIIDLIPGFRMDHSRLFKRSGDKLSLELRRGSPSFLRGAGLRRGRQVSIDLWFNRLFPRGRENWSERMRPDCSLRLATSSTSETDSKWLHFDAKYRIDFYRDIFHGEPDQAPADRSDTGPVAEDLLKMHAYRDAIVRTSGAFVLYPGLDEHPSRRAPYHEILPGLGAFVLRPAPNGEAIPASAQLLRQFIEDAIDHLSAIGTDEDRATFWRDRVYKEARGRRLKFEEWVDRPPADIKVLLGFLHGIQHLNWVDRTGFYNLRAGERVGSVGLTSPELAADVICLYDENSPEVWLYRSSGQLVLRTAGDLRLESYPSEPGSDLYCCLVLADRLEPPASFDGEFIRQAARRDRPRLEWPAPRCYQLDDLLVR